MIFKRMRELAIEKALKGELIEYNNSDFASDKSDGLNIDQQIDPKWQWFKLPELVSFKIGKTPYRGNINYWKGDVPWVAIADITASNGYISNTAECITELAKEECFKNNIAKAGSLLMSFKLSIGKMAILDIDAAHNEAIISMTVNNNSEISKKFLFYFLPYFAQKESKVNAVKGPTLNKDKLLRLKIACPEIKEQELIVQKLDTIFAEIDRAEKAYKELQSLANILRGQILQKAIQGKLVPQLPEDGVVEQIGEAPPEVPFELPASWKWCKLESIASIVRGASPRPIKNFLTTDEDGINWIKIGDSERGSKYISKCAEKITYDGSLKSRFVKRGSLLLTNSMSYGYPYILNVDGCIHDGWLSLSDFDNFINKEFLYYMLLSNYCRSVFVNKAAGAVVKNLNIDKVKSVYIPLPPLAEQKRIVAKVETLLEQIDLMTK